MKVRLKNIEDAIIEDGLEIELKNGDIFEAELPTPNLVTTLCKIPVEDAAEATLMLILEGCVFIGGENGICVPGNFYDIADEDEDQ